MIYERMTMKKLLAILLFLVSSSAFAQSFNTLFWDYPTTETRETGFVIERKAEACANPGAFAEIGRVAVNVLTYVDKAVNEGQFYCYQLRALYAGGVSDPSNAAGRLVPFTAPVAPANLRLQ